MKCQETIELRKKLIELLLTELLKQKPVEVNVNEIMAFCEDILRYLEEETEEEYETNQQFVGMKEVFRGHVVKDWQGTNLECKKYFVLNKIIVKHCVFFYSQCWKHRNLSMHDEDKQRDRLSKWYEKEKRKAENSEHNQIRLYVQKSKLDVIRCKCDTIRRWIMNLKRIEKRWRKYPKMT